MCFISSPGALLAAGVMFVAVRRLMMALIGGMTGDAAGAMVELVEVTCPLVPYQR